MKNSTEYRHTKDYWLNERESIRKDLDEGISLDAIGASYDVSRQRMYQILEQIDLKTNIKKRRKKYKGDTKKLWLASILVRKKFKVDSRLLEKIDTPEKCPILGIRLNYSGGTYKDRDRSASIDRIDSTIGYEEDNIHIISWRANRFKSDATIEELDKIITYLTSIACNK